MKITLDARLLAFSGIGTYIQNFLKHVAPYLAGIEWTFLVQREDRKFFDDLAVSKRLIDADSRPYSLSEQFQLWHKMPRHQDFVWYPHWNINLASRHRMIVTIHDLYHNHIGTLANRKQYYGSRPYLRRLLQLQPQILTVSNFTANELAQFGFRSVRVIPNFVDESWTATSALPSVKPAHPRDYFVFVSNLKPHKNLRTALLAFRNVLKLRPDLDFVVVGKTDDMLTIDRFSLDLANSLAPNVRTTGYVSDEELKRLVQNAVAAVCPSRYEGFGLTLLEAMKAGTPVLASRIPAHLEVAGDAALYFEPTDPGCCEQGMMRLATDRVLRDEMRRKGFERAKAFAVTTIRKQFKDYFEHLPTPEKF